MVVFLAKRDLQKRSVNILGNTFFNEEFLSDSNISYSYKEFILFALYSIYNSKHFSSINVESCYCCDPSTSQYP
jgi:hypothetical protein